MDILINITTYKRRKMLNKQLRRIKSLHTYVWDDNPTERNKPKSDFYHKFVENYGKKQAWKKFKIIFNCAKRMNYKYYLVIPDDVEIYVGQIEEAIRLWEELDDPRKICLSILTDKRTQKQNWTGVAPIPYDDVILTQWNDLCFLCEKEFFEQVELTEVDPHRWDSMPLLGSGVGSMISNQLYEKGWNMYHSTETLCKHIGTESKMNPEERKKTPL